MVLSPFAEEAQSVSVPPRRVVRRCLGSGRCLGVVAFFVFFGKFGQFTRFLHFHAFGTDIIRHGYLVEGDNTFGKREGVSRIARRKGEEMRGEERVLLRVGIESVHDSLV